MEALKLTLPFLQAQVLEAGSSVWQSWDVAGPLGDGDLSHTDYRQIWAAFSELVIDEEGPAHYG